MHESGIPAFSLMICIKDIPLRMSSTILLYIQIFHHNQWKYSKSAPVLYHVSLFPPNSFIVPYIFISFYASIKQDPDI